MALGNVATPQSKLVKEKVCVLDQIPLTTGASSMSWSIATERLPHFTVWFPRYCRILELTAQRPSTSGDKPQIVAVGEVSEFVPVFATQTFSGAVDAFQKSVWALVGDP
jgi:hypothetical protein